MALWHTKFRWWLAARSNFVWEAFVCGPFPHEVQRARCGLGGFDGGQGTGP